MILRADRVFFVSLFALGLMAGCPKPVASTPDGGVDAGVDVPVTCADDEQCNGGFCRGGVCVAEECQDKLECAVTKICSEGLCVDPPASCAGPADCPGTQLCDGFSDRCFDPNGGEGEGEGDVGEGEGDVGEGEGEGDVGEGEGEGEGDVGEGIALEGYRLENREAAAAQATVLPAGFFLDVGDVLVIGRSASRTDFEGFWGALSPNAQYLNADIATSGVPIVNGDELFTLIAPNGTVVDGPGRAGNQKKCYERKAQAPGADASWDEVATTEGTPGTISAPNVHGLVISEWCDAEGGGNFVFEYIEIANLP